MFYRCICGNETFMVKYLRLTCTKCKREYIADARITSDTFNRYKTALNELLWTTEEKRKVVNE
jgi:hypothetical protein